MALTASLLSPACRPARTCEADFGGVRAAARGGSPAREVFVTSDRPGDLAASDSLFVRVRFGAQRSGATGVPSHSVFIDTDGDRMSGMWTLQSSVSASAWNVLVDDGGLHVHEGPPNRWSWRRVDAPGFSRRTHEGTVDLCIPLRSVAPGRPRAVRVAVLAGDDWVPDAFLPGAVYPPARPSSVAGGPDEPAPMAIHYSGRPWVVRDCTDPDPADMTCPAREYAPFAHVVLTSGLEETGHQSHERATRLIPEIRRSRIGIEVWGYISLVGGPKGPDGLRSRFHSIDDIRTRAAAWKAMGATGIFLDEMDLCRAAWDQPCPRSLDGRPRSITRARQAAAVDAVHDLGMPVFANAFSPLDVLGPVEGVPSPLGAGDGSRAPDMYLLENPTVAGGVLREGLDADVSRARFTFARQARAERGIRLAAVDTAAGIVTDDPADPLYVRGFRTAAAARVDAYAFTNDSYSAAATVDRNLAVLPRPRD